MNPASDLPLPPHDEVPRYRPKRKNGKRPYAIEMRWFGRQWTIVKRYATEKQRDQAFEAYRKVDWAGDFRKVDP